MVKVHCGNRLGSPPADFLFRFPFAFIFHLSVLNFTPSNSNPPIFPSSLLFSPGQSGRLPPPPAVRPHKGQSVCGVISLGWSWTLTQGPWCIPTTNPQTHSDNGHVWPHKRLVSLWSFLINLSPLLSFIEIVSAAALVHAAAVLPDCSG